MDQLIAVTHGVLTLMGAVVAFKAAMAVWGFIRIFTTRLNVGWASKYGEKSWAIVTGCTEGIGKAFAFQLASLQFGLILISRNETKLQNLTNEIWAKYPRANIIFIKADFSEFSLKLYDTIIDKISHLDVSLLVNNVGMSHIKPMHLLTTREIQEMINVNIKAMTFLTNRVLPMMLERKKKSGIINLSSHGVLCPFKTLAVFIGTKAFNDLFSRCLSQDYIGKLDILSCRPCIVSSAATNHTTDSTACSSEDCARSTLKALGKVKVTSGHWNHILQSWACNVMGESITRWFGNLKIDSIQKDRRA